MNGTVKIGRWTYPAVQAPDGTVTRAEKRDGTGAWEETNPSLFIPDAGKPDAVATAVAQIQGFSDEPVKAPKKTHGGRVGAQTAKPGKSTWQPGDKCPKGHKLTDDDGDNPVYVMPSGRKQCRKCRKGYGSNGVPA